MSEFMPSQSGRNCLSGKCLTGVRYEERCCATTTGRSINRSGSDGYYRGPGSNRFGPRRPGNRERPLLGPLALLGRNRNPGPANPGPANPGPADPGPFFVLCIHFTRRVSQRQGQRLSLHLRRRRLPRQRRLPSRRQPRLPSRRRLPGLRLRLWFRRPSWGQRTRQHRRRPQHPLRFEYRHRRLPSQYSLPSAHRPLRTRYTRRGRRCRRCLYPWLAAGTAR